jgi:hypothetical protein
MSVFKLTTYERLVRYLANDANTPLSEDSGKMGLRQEYEGWIASVSKDIERWLNRSLKSESRTEYFHVKRERKRFWVDAYPISSVTSVYQDSTGQYSGNEDEIESDDWVIGESDRSIDLDYSLLFNHSKGLRVIYTGGLAAHATRSTFAITSAVNTFTAGRWVKNSDNTAAGIVRGTPTSAQVILDNLWGVFAAGDALTEYTDQHFQTATDPAVTATISSITAQSLAESQPSIVRACEAQIMYMNHHKGDFELVGSTRDAVNLRRSPAVGGEMLTLEVRRMLRPYRSVIGEF